MLPLLLSAWALVSDDSLNQFTLDKALAKPGMRSAFLRFCVKTNEECDRSASAWSAFYEEAEFEETSWILVGSVDCDDASAGSLCKRHNISGYPTYGYLFPGDPVLDPYEGGTGARDLIAFARELKGGCYPEYRARCDKEQAALLKEAEKEGVEAIRSKIADERRKIAESRSGLHDTLTQYNADGRRAEKEETDQEASSEAEGSGEAEMDPGTKRAAKAAAAQQAMLFSLVKRDQAISMGKGRDFRIWKAYLAWMARGSPGASGPAEAAKERGKKPASRASGGAKKTKKEKAGGAKKTTREPDASSQRRASIEDEDELGPRVVPAASSNNDKDALDLLGRLTASESEEEFNKAQKKDEL